MNELAKRVIVAVIIFFLVAFTYVNLKKLAAVESENIRLEAVNGAIGDTVAIWRDRFAAADTVLQRQLATIDSLSARTGPIRWRTVRDTIIVIEPGRIDTLIVEDSVAVIEVDSAVHFIPTVVALELQECRLFKTTCAEYKHNADSLIRWQAVRIDTLIAQVDNLDKRFDIPELAFLGLSLPLPQVTAGYGIMYSMNGCGSEETSFEDEILVVTKPQCDKLHHGIVLGLTWRLWSP